MKWLRKFYGKIYQLYDKQIDGTGLAVFRISYGMVLLGEILFIYYFRHLIFDKIPYISPGEIDMAPALIIWMISVIFIIFGFATRLSTIVNYIMTVVVIGTTSSYEYHMFYAYLGINTLLMFMPISQNMSIDRLFKKLKYSNTKFRYQPKKTVSSLNYIIPVLLGVGFVYIDSVFFKISSDFWTRGLGVWLPSSMPQTVFLDTSFLMNIKWLAIGMGYLTFLFEAVFIFIFWRKRFRVTCMIIGLCLHIGILISYPIPFFALGVSAIYLLLVPVGFWKRVFGRDSSKTDKKLIFYYDGECPLCTRTRITLEHFDTGKKIEFKTVQEGIYIDDRIKDIPLEKLLDDIHSVDNKDNIYSGVDTYIQVFKYIWYLKPISWILRIPGIYHIAKSMYKFIATNRTTERCTDDNCGYTIPELPAKDAEMKILTNYTLADLKVFAITGALILACVFQLIAIYNSPSINNLKESIANNNKAISLTSKVANGITGFTKTWFGITKHGVFMDSHFYHYNHSIAVVYKGKNKSIWLPLTDSDGTPGNYLFGSNWVKYTFRVNNPNINQDELEKGIRDFTAFWAYKHHVNLEEAEFEIKVKKNKQPTHWEKDFLHRQLSHPWIDGGKVYWKNKEYTSEIKNIEFL